MKKMVCAILAAFLLLLVAPLSASAAGAAEITITPAKTTLNPGDTITFTVTVANCNAASSMGIIPTYDENLFRFVSGEWLLTGALLADFSDGVAAIAYPDAREISGAVLTFTLQVKEDVTLKSTSVTAIVSIKNLSETVECSVTPASMKEHKQSLIVSVLGEDSTSEKEDGFPVFSVLIGAIVCAALGIGIFLAVRRKPKHGK